MKNFQVKSFLKSLQRKLRAARQNQSQRAISQMSSFEKAMVSNLFIDRQGRMWFFVQNSIHLETRLYGISTTHQLLNRNAEVIPDTSPTVKVFIRKLVRHFKSKKSE